MLAMELPRGSGEFATVPRPCPSCGRSMHLARKTPQPGGLADLCVFKCGECGVWLSEASDQRRAV
jgi:hypothetical protein